MVGRGSVLNDTAAVEQRVSEVGKRYGLKIKPDARVSELSVGEQQRVEIVKALYRGVSLLILDEPTAVLTPQETTDLFHTLRSLTADGLAVIFITHKLNEVMAVSDRVTVLRDGKVVGQRLTSETSIHDLAELMVGREVQMTIDKPAVDCGDELLRHREPDGRGRARAEGAGPPLAAASTAARSSASPGWTATGSASSPWRSRAC